MPELRVLVVEDEPLYRELLVSALSARLPNVTIVGNCGTAGHAVALATDDSIDVLLTDVDLGAGPTGVELGVDLKRRGLVKGVVLLSNLALPAVLTTLPVDAQSGWAYLLKTSVADLEQVAEAMHAAADGSILIDHSLVKDLAPSRNSPISRLSPRQREVLSRVALGWSNRRIAEDLVLSVRSVESNISGIIAALGIEAGDYSINPRVAAVLAFVQQTDFEGIRQPS